MERDIVMSAVLYLQDSMMGAGTVLRWWTSSAHPEATDPSAPESAKPKGAV